MTYLYLKDSSVTREPDARSGPSPHLGKEGNDESFDGVLSPCIALNNYIGSAR